MRCDPHAAAVVYRAPARLHRSIGLDVTLQVQMRRDEVERRFRHPLLRPVLDFAGYWFKHQPLMTSTTRWPRDRFRTRGLYVPDRPRVH